MSGVPAMFGVSGVSGVSGMFGVLCNIPEATSHCYRRENTPEDRLIRLYLVSLCGEANQHRYHGNKTVESKTLKMEATCSAKRHP
jgi:hypothetical protein